MFPNPRKLQSEELFFMSVYTKLHYQDVDMDLSVVRCNLYIILNTLQVQNLILLELMTSGLLDDITRLGLQVVRLIFQADYHLVP